MCACAHAVSCRCCVQLYEESLQDAAGNYPGPATGVFWQFQAPAGLQLMLSWVSQRYQRPEVWVTENGVALPGEHNMTLQDALNDAPRVDFFRWGSTRDNMWECAAGAVLRRP